MGRGIVGPAGLTLRLGLKRLYAVTGADGRLIRFLMTAGHVSDSTGAASLFCGLPSAEWILADRGQDASSFRNASKDEGYSPEPYAGSLVANQSNAISAATNAAPGSSLYSED